MKRRDFLRYLGCTAVATSGLALHPQLRAVQAATGKKLVVIFQRGGCDGLNTVVPYGEDEYYRLRPSISIAPPSAGNPHSAIDLDGFFGLHPSLARLAPIYRDGNVAILPTVHYENATRSHFDGQVFIESGAPRKGIDGWLNRYVAGTPGAARLRAVNFGYRMAHAMQGDTVVDSFADLETFNLGVEADVADAHFGRVSGVFDRFTANLGAFNRRYLRDSGRALIQDRQALSGTDTSDYLPANGASYPDSAFGRRLRQTAQLIKDGTGLEVAAITSDDWDTHAKQGGGDPEGLHSKSLSELAAGIAALYADLGDQMDDVLILTMTEFGRTAKENGSGGTDHGNASTWFAIGGGVNGGIHMGQEGWPGLLDHQLHKGRYLRHTVDYRDIMAEVLTRQLGMGNTANMLPAHVHTPIGFLSA